MNYRDSARLLTDFLRTAADLAWLGTLCGVTERSLSVPERPRIAVGTRTASGPCPCVGGDSRNGQRRLRAHRAREVPGRHGRRSSIRPPAVHASRVCTLGAERGHLDGRGRSRTAPHIGTSDREEGYPSSRPGEVMPDDKSARYRIGRRRGERPWADHESRCTARVPPEQGDE